MMGTGINFTRDPDLASLTTTLDQVSGVINVQDPPYLALGNGIADDTAAIQAAIDAAAAAGSTLFFPATPTGTFYKFTKLTIPTGHTNVFTMAGDGPGTDYSAATPASYHRTTLVSTDTTGPAIVVDGGAGYTTRGLIIEGMTIVATNTTSVISLTNANTGTALKRLIIEQDGTGGGIDWTTTWFATLEDVLVQSGASSITAGSVGLRVKNIVDGGIVNVTRCTVQMKSGGTGGFDIGMQFGALTTDPSSWKHHIDAVTLVSCTAQHCNTGLALGYGTRGASVIGQHIEFCNTQGIWITNIAGPLAVLGGFSYNPTATVADVTIDGDATSNDQNALSFIGHDFRAVNLYGFDFKGAAYTSGMVKQCRFNLYTAGATAFRTRSTLLPWELGPNTMSGGTTEYDDATVVRLRYSASSGTMVGLGGYYSPGGTGTFKAAVIGTDGIANSGSMTNSGYIEWPEQSDFAAPAANKVRVYCRDNGAGKTQIVARFPTGAVQVLATEP